MVSMYKYSDYLIIFWVMKMKLMFNSLKIRHIYLQFIIENTLKGNRKSGDSPDV